MNIFDASAIFNLFQSGKSEEQNKTLPDSMHVSS